MNQTQFTSGAVRSTDANNTRYDLVSPIGLRRLAETCHEGAKKYGDRNWEKGMPIGDILNHALRHMMLYLQGYRHDPLTGNPEDHLAHAAWNLFAAMHMEEACPEIGNSDLRPVLPVPEPTPAPEALTLRYATGEEPEPGDLVYPEGSNPEQRLLREVLRVESNSVIIRNDAYKASKLNLYSRKAAAPAPAPEPGRYATGEEPQLGDLVIPAEEKFPGFAWQVTALIGYPPTTEVTVRTLSGEKVLPVSSLRLHSRAIAVNPLPSSQENAVNPFTLYASGEEPQLGDFVTTNPKNPIYYPVWEVYRLKYDNDNTKVFIQQPDECGIMTHRIEPKISLYLVRRADPAPPVTPVPKESPDVT